MDLVQEEKRWVSESPPRGCYPAMQHPPPRLGPQTGALASAYLPQLPPSPGMLSPPSMFYLIKINAMDSLQAKNSSQKGNC